MLACIEELRTVHDRHFAPCRVEHAERNCFSLFEREGDVGGRVERIREVANQIEGDALCCDRHDRRVLVRPVTIHLTQAVGD